MSIQSDTGPAIGRGQPEEEAGARSRRLERQRFVARYVAGKLASAVFVLWAAVTLSFLSIHFAPGDPVTLLMGEVATPELRAAVERDWGLDRPLLDQYVDYLGNVVQGNFGFSYAQNAPVNDILFGPRLMASAELTAFAVVTALVLAIVIAVATAGRKGIIAGASQLTELVFASMPSFWLGIVLITIVAFNLGWLPVTAGSGFRKLILPGLTLALPLAAVLSQVIREGIERSLEQPYSVTARARGIGFTRLKYAHALRHSLLPAMTLSGWAVGGMLTGTVVVEQVFGRTGIGQATVVAVTLQDIPVVLAVALLSAVIYVAVNTLVDILYLWADPRLRAR
jgi:peptide/nickel transport system permease protein